MTTKILNGDCIERLSELENASIDAVVTDPPSGINFMGKSWDNKTGYQPKTRKGKLSNIVCSLLGLESWERGFFMFLIDVFVTVKPKLKPGGHLLVWALPRTSDLTALALRAAGFEIRDSVHHVFGTGFPKSHNVSKSIDKVAGAYDANTWDGWGTALKPAHEVWWLARKPIEGTIAKNVLKNGTGALNIDGCRVGNGNDRAQGGKSGDKAGLYEDGFHTERQDRPVGGRWPSNLLLSHSEACAETCAPDCPVAEMDAQSGERVSGGSQTKTKRKVGVYEDGLKERIITPYTDIGGASRFFPCFKYVAKPSKSERNAGLEEVNHHPTVKSIKLMRWLVRLICPKGGTVLDPFMGSGTTGCAAVDEEINFIGIERDPEYARIAEARMKASCKHKAKRAATEG